MTNRFLKPAAIAFAGCVFVGCCLAMSAVLDQLRRFPFHIIVPLLALLVNGIVLLILLRPDLKPVLGRLCLRQIRILPRAADDFRKRALSQGLRLVPGRRADKIEDGASGSSRQVPRITLSEVRAVVWRYPVKSVRGTSTRSEGAKC